MYHFAKIEIFIIMVGLLISGCAPKSPSVPMATKNIDYPSTINNTNSKNAKLFIHTNWRVPEPLQVSVDNKIFNLIPADSYAYYELNEGIHWISVYGKENSSFECKKFVAGKQYFKKIDISMGIAAPRVELIDSAFQDMEGKNQVLQNNKTLTSSFSSFTPSSMSIQTISDNENLKTIQLKLIEKIHKNNIIDGNDLQIKLVLLNYTEGSQLGRYFWGGTSKSEDYKSVLSVRVEFYDKNNNKLDEYYSKKSLSAGIFGGDKDNLVLLIADDIYSYIACKYIKI